jgi:hypothetical protein
MVLPDCAMWMARSPATRTSACAVRPRIIVSSGFVLTSFGRAVLRKGVKPRFPELMGKGLFVAAEEFFAPLLEESARGFRQIFLAGR